MAGDGRALLEAAREHRPNVVVLDIAMPLMNGLEAGQRLLEEMPGIRLVWLTMNEDPNLTMEKMRSGADFIRTR